MTELREIAVRTGKGTEVPRGTKVWLRLGRLPGYVHVKPQLPGQRQTRDLGDLPIVDGALALPLRLVFLRHATEDERAVESLPEQLLQDGFLTWYAPKDLKGRPACRRGTSRPRVRCRASFCVAVPLFIRLAVWVSWPKEEGEEYHVA